jgi:transposase InsO family protein
MKQCRTNLARLNRQIKEYMLDNYKVIDYEVRKPSPRPEITRRPYGYHKWRRAKIAHRRCIKFIQQMHTTIEVRSTRKKPKQMMRFDTDSYDILVDNCCSQSITNSLQDFIKPPTLSEMRIRGFNGHTTQTKVGTVKWLIHDDEGRLHSIILPNTYYSPHAESRLLSPQHWAQTARNGRGTKCTTYHDAIILEWDNRKYKRTIPINDKTRNVGIINTPTGIKRYLHECERYERAHQVIAFPATIEQNEDLPMVTDDEEEQADQDIQSIKTTQPEGVKETNHPGKVIESIQHEGDKERERSTPLQIGFEETQHDIVDEHPTFLDDVQEYMHWHYRLNHASHVVMIKLANKKMLPQRITQLLKKMDKQRAKPPMCNDCYCANASRTPWRGKATKDDKKKSERRSNLKPGDVVSIDQLESSVPGFLGQQTGTLTRQRIVGSSVYVDHASDLSYIYHHTALTSEETVKGKEAFEAYAKAHGVRIKHYHADNGRFKDNAFLKSIQENHQTISFSGVGAHHQNGIAEKRIGDLQRRATTLLLHAQRRWPDAINSHLWTYAIRAANDGRNNAPTRNNDE